jgi:ABC-2 type transport system permease protein
LLLAILAIGFGAGTIAGEEERGTLELVVSHPVKRTRIVSEKALVFGAIAFLVGAATGHRALAIGLATAGAVAAYLVNGLAALVEALEVPQKLSPFYHYAVGDPLRQGLALDHTLVLVALALAAALAGVLAFERRDLASS